MTTGGYMSLAATGSYLPRQRLHNDELKQKYQLDTSHEWIHSRSGISYRHIAEADETTAFMAVSGVQQALDKAGWQAKELDLLVCATCTPDRSLPSVALDIHQALACRSNCAAFDISAACSGFIYALNIVNAMMLSSPHIKRAAIVCSERMSSIVDWSDRSTAVLFGDGAGAVLMTRSDKPGHYLTHLYADGSYNDLLNSDPQSDTIVMQGRAVYRHAVAMMEGLIDDLFQQAQLSSGDIDRLVPHQANYRIIQTLANKLGLSSEQVIMNIEQLGNTSAASIPIALDQGIESGKIQPGHLLLFEAFGAGFVWGGSLLRY